MVIDKPTVTRDIDPKQTRAKTEWHSASRQAQRDVVRMGWARHVLEEEKAVRLTHSAARIRRALNIVAALQDQQP